MSTKIRTNNKYTEQHILNGSFDEDFDVLAVSLLGYDTVSNSVKRVTMDALNHYATNDTDNSDSNNFYEGLEDSAGSWQIAKISKDGLLSHHRYATNLNNITYTSYSDAWTDRVSLTYDLYSIAF